MSDIRSMAEAMDDEPLWFGALARRPVRGTLDEIAGRALSDEAAAVQSNLVLGQCPHCFEINRHAENCLRMRGLEHRRDCMCGGCIAKIKRKPSYGATLVAAARGTHRSVVIIEGAAQWLHKDLTVRKAELLKEQRHYLRTRTTPTQFENMLAEIERDVAHINVLLDALS